MEGLGVRSERWEHAASRVRTIVSAIEMGFDRSRFAVKRHFGWVGPVDIMAYRSYGTQQKIRVVGRVEETKGLQPPQESDSRWTNFRSMLRRLESDEIPHAWISASLAGSKYTTRTDSQGYFSLAITPPESAVPEPEGCFAVELELLSKVSHGQGPVHTRAEVFVPPESARLGVISDIDDTVIQTNVTSFPRMLATTLFGNLLTRLPFEGTDRLYRGLTSGLGGVEHNPIFYVSKSPWGLYDLLRDFLDHHGLPPGPLLLRDIGLHPRPPTASKRARIQHILKTYPKLPFVLIGDSGERDPELYVETARTHPGRIKGIYIRNVGFNRRGRRTQRDYSAEAREAGTELLFMDDASAAYEHAVQAGLIR